MGLKKCGIIQFGYSGRLFFRPFMLYQMKQSLVMFLQEIAPAPTLLPFIEKYVVLPGQKKYHIFHRDKVPLDFSEGLIFNFGPPIPWAITSLCIYDHLPGGLILPGCIQSASWQCDKGSDCFVVVFRPGKFRCLFPYGVFEFMGNFLNSKGITETPLLHFYHHMMLAKTVEERIDVSNQYLEKSINKLEHKSRITQEALSLITTDLKLSICEISEHLEVTCRHFRRVFSSEMGIQPKRFQKLVRISVSIELLSNGGNDKINDIVYECGFYDQSHFNNSFKNYIGMTPGQYFQ